MRDAAYTGPTVRPVRTRRPASGGHRGTRGLLARQRHAYILDRLRIDGAVRVADLVHDLGVSDMTIRRDLEVLHDQRLLEKVHGGATTITPSALFEPGFRAKAELQQDAKEAIAEVAAGLVSPEPLSAVLPAEVPLVTDASIETDPPPPRA